MGYMFTSQILGIKSVITSVASLTHQYRGRAEIDAAWFKDFSEGLIALSGARFGDVGIALLAGQDDEARQKANEGKEPEKK